MKEQRWFIFFKRLSVSLALMLMCFVTSAIAAESGFFFCKDFSDDLTPIDASDEFTENEVSWIAYSNKPFNASSIVFTIYKRDDNGSESMIHREKVDIRPAWNNLFLKKMPFPGDGIYILSIDKEDGGNIAEGTVTIKAIKSPEAEASSESASLDNLDIQGAELKRLFDSFKLKATPGQS